MSINSEQMQYTVCPVCSSTIKTWRVKNVDNDKYNLDLCKSCGYSFVNPRPSLQFLMNYYASFGHGHFENVEDIPNLVSVIEKERIYPNATIDAKRLINTIKSLAKSLFTKSEDLSYTRRYIQFLEGMAWGMERTSATRNGRFWRLFWSRGKRGVRASML